MCIVKHRSFVSHGHAAAYLMFCIGLMLNYILQILVLFITWDRHIYASSRAPGGVKRASPRRYNATSRTSPVLHRQTVSWTSVKARFRSYTTSGTPSQARVRTDASPRTAGVPGNTRSRTLAGDRLRYKATSRTPTVRVRYKTVPLRPTRAHVRYETVTQTARVLRYQTVPGTPDVLQTVWGGDAVARTPTKVVSVRYQTSARTPAVRIRHQTVPGTSVRVRYQTSSRTPVKVIRNQTTPGPADITGVRCKAVARAPVRLRDQAGPRTPVEVVRHQVGVGNVLPVRLWCVVGSVIFLCSCHSHSPHSQH